MHNDELRTRFDRLTTAHVADGCLRAGQPVRCAPAGTHAITRNTRLSGRVLPARHSGSVDVFLEAFESAEAGDVLVVDNGGRLDESCVGDLVTLEARAAGLGGIAIWGLHRDTADIRRIDLPVFSLGSLPTGPLAATDRHEHALVSARFGEQEVGASDAVFGDEDGLLFVALDHLDAVLTAAEQIRDTERAQAERITRGDTLRSQVRFAAFLEARSRDATLTFRDHLRAVGGAIEV
jgi:regulator of RNase E activity RraA